MLFYCVKFRKNTESKKPKVEKIKNERIILSSMSTVFSSKKSRFIKDQKSIRLLSITPLLVPLFI